MKWSYSIFLEAFPERKGKKGPMNIVVLLAFGSLAVPSPSSQRREAFF
jgi:hypothetical protein